ncbi:MAG: hypothetical protein M5R38_18600 [Candidatus Methylomirabilis sp.]|nr:hypothetical protein [Candidatus Methylomirabilis sp.]
MQALQPCLAALQQLGIVLVASAPEQFGHLVVSEVLDLLYLEEGRLPLGPLDLLAEPLGDLVSFLAEGKQIDSVPEGKPPRASSASARSSPGCCPPQAEGV